MKTDSFPTFFGMFAILAFVGGMILYITRKKLQNWMHGADQ
ncbi:Uncharacterized protein GNX_2243 [Leptospira interrogans serovar Canicola]|nr:Uncharacterized protein GNX_2243 [Leptospira interrogans serovar Canicola]